ncbi:MAG: hypothetical protein AAF433_19330 [Bacteroidota bacterium]
MKDLNNVELLVSGGAIPFPLILIDLRDLPIGEDITLGDLLPPQ